MNKEVHILGIRHHGPGSSRRMLDALDEWQPDRILIEGPVHASSLIEKVHDVTPPIALAQLHKKTRTPIGFYPFAEYSPEWQAIKWSWKMGREVCFIDLPGDSPQFHEESYETDPLGQLALASGFSDAENWWEYHFEQSHSSSHLFQELSHLIAQIRQSGPSGRERFMAQQIALQHIPGSRTAVICGAWHAPVLEKWQDILPESPENSPATSNYYWIPWSYLQLAREKGYGAGVRAPMYYECLWSHRSDAAAHWFVHAGRIFRKKELDVSPAHLIEATRLAHGLASLRMRETPGLDELTDAIQAVFPKSEAYRWQALRDEVWLGTKTGYVNPSIHHLPLIEDFYSQLRKFRLFSAVKQGVDVEKKLDLRKEGHLKMSTFFYQLLAMDLGWPVRVAADINHLGSYNEYWILPADFLLDARLIQHVHKGQTVRDAGLYELRSQLAQSDHLSLLMNWLELALYGSYSEALPELATLSESRMIEEEDGVVSLAAWVKVAGLIRFGDVRSYDVSALKRMLNYLFGKIYIHLPISIQQTSEEAVTEVMSHLKTFHQSRSWSNEQWSSCLFQISQNPNLISKLRGLCFRLFSQLGERAELDSLIQMEFSSLRDPGSTTEWLTGFFSAGKTDFIQNTSLLQYMDQWVSGLSDTHFDDVLIGLREAFSIFSEVEKQEIQKLRFAGNSTTPGSVEKDSPSLFRDLFLEIIQGIPKGSSAS